MLDLKQVTYRYPGQPEPILDRLDLQLEDARALLVTGHSGVGKSSLLRTFNGLVPHFHGGTLSGRLRVAGRDPVALGPRGMSRHVGFVGQDPESHFVCRRVEDELAFGLENHAVTPREMGLRIERVLERLAIAHLRHREVATLSGGERQRVAIASVLTLAPPLLVLDEPTSQLDPLAVQQVLDDLSTLRRQGTSLVISEHRLQRLLPWADQLLLLTADRPPRMGDGATLLADSPLAPPLLQLSRLLTEGPSDGSATLPPLPLDLEAARRHVAVQRLRQRLRRVPATVAATTHTAPPRTAPAAIVVEGLSVSYGDRQALQGVDLELPRGSLTALIGCNGAGKSTLLESLVGLVTAQHGRIHLATAEGELDPQRQALRQITRQVAFVPQNPARLMFHHSVAAEMAFSLAGHQLDASEGPRHLRRFGLEGLDNAYPRDLSSGERQRLAVALMTVQAPSILLLDEPTRGLDELSKQLLVACLENLRGEGVTIVMATHDVELVAACADRAVLLEAGRVVAHGATGTVLQASPPWRPQMLELLEDPRFLTVAQIRDALASQDTSAPDCPSELPA